VCGYITIKYGLDHSYALGVYILKYVKIYIICLVGFFIKKYTPRA